MLDLGKFQISILQRRIPLDFLIMLTFQKTLIKKLQMYSGSVEQLL